MVSAIDATHWKKGDQMRYKAVFIAGVAVGFVAGARAGRGAYDKIVSAGQQVAGHPKVQQAASAAQARASGLAKTAAAKAPDYAKTAAASAASAAKTAQAQVSQVPKYAANAKQAATGKLPARFGGRNGADSTADSDPAADPRVSDHVDAAGNLVYPAEGSPSQVNGVRRHYTPDTP